MLLSLARSSTSKLSTSLSHSSACIQRGSCSEHLRSRYASTGYLSCRRECRLVRLSECHAPRQFYTASRVLAEQRRPCGQRAQATVSSAQQPGANAKGAKEVTTEQHASPSQGLRPFHLAAFVILLGGGLAFLAVLLYFTADIEFQRACMKVLRRLFKTVALRRVLGILAAMTFLRLGLEPLVKGLRSFFSVKGAWEKSSEFYILLEVTDVHGVAHAFILPSVLRTFCGSCATSLLFQVYKPLEFLFTIAAITTLAENFLPQLIALPKVRLCIKRRQTVRFG